MAEQGPRKVITPDGADGGEDNYLFSYGIGAKGGPNSAYDPRYPVEGADPETARALNQPLTHKVGAALLKGTGLAAGTLATGAALAASVEGAPVGLLALAGWGAYNSAVDDNPETSGASDFIDGVINNPLTQFFDKMNEKLEEVAPIYETKDVREADAFSAKNIFSSSFMLDKLVKNMGYAVGAQGAMKFSAKTLGKLAELSTRNSRAAEALYASMGNTAGLEAAIAKTAKITKAWNTATPLASAFMSAFGEATGEASETKRTVYEKLVEEELRRMKGDNPFYDPTPDEIPKERLNMLEAQATNAQHYDFAANLALLTFSDFVQFGKSVKSGASEVNQSVRRAVKEGVTAPTNLMKWSDRLKEIGTPLATEGFEEGAQHFLQQSAMEYSKLKTDGESAGEMADILHAARIGVEKVFGTKEGQESLLLGALTGGIMHVGGQAISGELGDSMNRVENNYNEAKGVSEKLNEATPASLFTTDTQKGRYEGSVRYLAIQRDMQDAIARGDAFQYKNLKYDQLKNTVQLQKEYGDIDAFIERIDDLKNMDVEDFATQFDVDLGTVKKEGLTQYIDKLVEQTKGLANLYDSVEARFPTASKEDKEVLWSALANSTDAERREKELYKKISHVGVKSMMEAISEGRTPAEYTADLQEKALEYAENNPALLSKEDVADYFALIDRRKQAVNQYNYLSGRVKNGERIVTPPPTPEAVAPIVPPLPPTPVAYTDAQLIARLHRLTNGEGIASAEDEKMQEAIMARPDLMAAYTQASQGGTLADFLKGYGIGSVAVLDDNTKEVIAGLLANDKPLPAAMQKLYDENKEVIDALVKSKKIEIVNKATLNALESKRKNLAEKLDAVLDKLERGVKFPLQKGELDKYEQMAAEYILAFENAKKSISLAPVYQPQVFTNKIAQIKKLLDPAPVTATDPKLAAAILNVYRDGLTTIDDELVAHSLNTGRLQPESLIIRHEKINGKEQFNVYALDEEFGIVEEVKIGYLTQYSAHSLTKGGPKVEGKDTPEWKKLEEIKNRARASDTGIEVNSTLTFALNSKEGETANNSPRNTQFILNRAIGVYRQRKSRDRDNSDITMFKDDNTLLDVDDAKNAAIKESVRKMSDGIVIAYNDPQGNTRYFGAEARAMDMQSAEAITPFNEAIQTADLATRLALLNDMLFLASGNTQYTLQFDSNKLGKQYVYIAVRTASEDGQSEDVGKIYFPNKPFKSFQALLDAMTFGTGMEDVAATPTDLFSAKPFRINIDNPNNRSFDNVEISVNDKAPFKAYVKVANESTAVVAPPTPAPIVTQAPVLAPTSVGGTASLNLATQLNGIADATIVEAAPFKVGELSAEGQEIVERGSLEEVRKRLGFLGSKIGVQELEDTVVRSIKNGTVWGYMKKATLHLATKYGKGTEYHEAFHAVFNAQLNMEEREAAFDLTNEMDLSDAAVSNFIAKYPGAEFWNDSQVVRRMREEYLADKFADFMLYKEAAYNKKGKLGKLVSRAFDWLFNKIRGFVMWFKGNPTSLDEMFDTIASGYYMNRTLRDAGDSTFYKIMPGLLSKESEKVVGSIMLTYLTTEDNVEYKDMKKRDIINAIIDKIKPSYAEDVDLTRDMAEYGKYLSASQKRVGEDGKIYPLAFLTSRDELASEAAAWISKFKEATKEQDDDEASRMKDISFDVSLFELSNFDSLGKAVKAFLTLVGTESNGIYTPIDVAGTFAQMQRVLEGSVSYEEMVRRIERLSREDATMKLVYENLQRKADDEGFKQSFKVAFDWVFMDSMHVDLEINEGSPEKSGIKVYSANRQNPDVIMANRYSKQVTANIAKGYDIQGFVKQALKLIDGNMKKVEKQDELLILLHSIGFTVSGSFVHDIYSDVSRTADEETSVKAVVADIKEVLKQLVAKGAQQVFLDDEEGKGAMGRVKRIGAMDASFRNDVYISSTKNAENEMITSYVRPNLEFLKARQLEDGTADVSSAWHQLNPLVQRMMATPGDVKKLNAKLQSFNGIKEAKSQEGLVAKSVDPKSYLIATHMLFQTGNVLPFVHESKSTYTMINLGTPAYTVKQTGQVTAAGKEAILNFMKQDAMRILRVKGEIEQFKSTPSKWREAEQGWHFAGKERAGYKDGQPVFPDLTDPASFTKARGLVFAQIPQMNAFVKSQSEVEGGNYFSTVQDILDGKLDEALKSFFFNAGGVLDTMLEDHRQLLIERGIPTANAEWKLTDTGKKNYKLLAGEANVAPDAFGADGFKNYLRDFVLSQFILTNSYSQLIRGDEGRYAGPIDISKRAAALIASGPSLGEGEAKAIILSDEFHFYKPTTAESVRFDDNSTEYLEFLANPTIDDVTYEPSMKGYTKYMASLGFEQVNTTDAQSYVTWKRWLFIQERLGRFTRKKSKLAKRAINGETLTREEWDELESAFVTSVDKPVYFDGQYYVKTSIIALFPSLTSDPTTGYTTPLPGREEMHDLRVKMEQNGIDEAYRESGVKLGIRNKLFRGPLDENGVGTYDITPESAITISNKFWRLQQENPSGKEKITLGTQLLQLIDAEMSDNTDVEYNGQTRKLGEVRREYQNLLANLTEKKYVEATKMLETLQIGTEKHNLFFNVMRQTMIESGAATSELEYLEQVRGELTYGTDLPHMSQKIQQLFLSYFNKNVFGKKVPGMKLTLVSSEGFKVWDEQLQSYRPLRVHHLADGKLAYAEVILSEEMLQKKGITRAEFEKAPQRVKDEILTMLGFRIPTQSHHSMLPFKVVDFVPAHYGSIVIAPPEVTFLAGSDYDVDSLFVNMKAWYAEREEAPKLSKEEKAAGKKRIKKEDMPVKNIAVYRSYRNKADKTHYKEWKKTLENSKAFKLVLREITKQDGKKTAPNKLFDKACQVLNLPTTFEAWNVAPQYSDYAYNNNILDDNLEMLNSPDIHKSMWVPAGVDGLKSAKNHIMAAKGLSDVSVSPYNSAAALNRSRNANVQGSEGIGSAANAGKTSAVLNKLDVQLAVPIVFAGVEYKGFGEAMENDIDLDAWNKTGELAYVEKRKANTISTLISAMTDNAKEQLAAFLNLFGNNLRIVGFMNALGMGENRSVLFINQPVISHLSNMFIFEKSYLMGEGETWDLSNGLFENFRAFLGPARLAKYAGLDYTDAELLKYASKEWQDLYDSMNQDIRKGKTRTLSEFGDRQEEVEKFLYYQYSVLADYVSFESYEKEFGAVNRLLNTNKGDMASFARIDKVREDYDTITDGESIFQDLGQKFAEQLASIDRNIDLMVYNTNSLYAQGPKFFVSRTAPVMSVYDELADKLNDKDKEGFMKDFGTELSMRTLNKLLKGYMNVNLEDMEKLIDPKNKVDNIAQQYTDLLRDYPELSENLIVKSLTPANPSDSNPYYRVEYNSAMQVDSDYKEKVMNAYKELMNPGLPKRGVRSASDFATNLFLYLAIKDGLQYRNGSFVSIITPSRFKGIADGIAKAKLLLDEYHKGGADKSAIDRDFATLLGVPGLSVRGFMHEFTRKWVKGFRARKKQWLQLKGLTDKEKEVNGIEQTIRNYDGKEVKELHFKRGTSESPADYAKRIEKYIPKIQTNMIGEFNFPLILKTSVKGGEPILYVRKYKAFNNEVIYTVTPSAESSKFHSPYSVNTEFFKGREELVKMKATQSEPEEVQEAPVVGTPAPEPVSPMEPQGPPMPTPPEMGGMPDMEAMMRRAMQVIGGNQQRLNLVQEPNVRDVLQRLLNQEEDC